MVKVNNYKILLKSVLYKWLTLVVLLSPSYVLISATQPSLIIDSVKVSNLANYKNYDNLGLYSNAIASADSFCSLPLPEMQNADNKYRHIGENMPSLGLAYLLTSEQKYLDASVKIIESLLAVKEWSGDDNLGRSAWVTGTILLYDWLYNSLSTDLRLRIQERMITEGSIIMETASKYRALSNHLMIETTALGLIGLALKNETHIADTFINQANTWTKYIINHAPLDGSWGEGIQYWEYGLRNFILFLEASKTSGNYNFYPEYNWLKQTGYFNIFFSLPDNYSNVINFSDCSSKRKVPSFLLFLPASEYKNEYFQDFGLKLLMNKPVKYSWANFVFYDKSVQPKDISELSTFKHFNDNGFVAMRSNWSDTATIIGFRCGPAPGHANQNHPDRIRMHGFGPGHGQPDINSFNIYSHGEWLAIDPGYTYKKETRNHNTIVSNGRGQSGAGFKWLDYMVFESRNPAPEIIKAVSNKNYDYIIGDVGNLYIDEAKIKKFQRHLIFLKKENIIIIYDDILTKDSSTIEWILNATSSIEELNNDSGFLINGSNVNIKMRMVSSNKYKSIISERNLRASDINPIVNSKEGIMNTLTLKFENCLGIQNIVVMQILKDNEAIANLVYENSILSINLGRSEWKLNFARKNESEIIKIK